MKPGRLCTPFFVLLLTISATVFAQSQLTLDPIQHATSPSTDIARLRTEADQGNAAAQNNLGVVYANGTGVAKDPAQAVFWYRKAADQGDAAAQNNLGVAYANGTGIGISVTNDNSTWLNLTNGTPASFLVPAGDDLPAGYLGFRVIAALGEDVGM